MHTPDPATSYRRVALKAPAPVAGAVRAARPTDAASAPRTLPSDTSEQPETRRGSAELSRRPAAGLAECGPDDPAGTVGEPKGASVVNVVFLFFVVLRRMLELRKKSATGGVLMSENEDEDDADWLD